MRQLAIACLVALLSARPSVAIAQQVAELPISSVAAKVRSAVVTIYVYDAKGQRIALGSGFISSDGRVVTNRHVIEGGSRAEIFGAEGQMLGVAPFADVIGTQVDLAILPAIADPPGRIALAKDIPPVGGSIVVVGAPQGLQNSVSEGIVSAVRSLNPGRILQITAPISPGSSGGPVLNRTGDVVGVAFSQISEGQNLNFAVPSDAVRALLGSPVTRSPFPPGPAVAAAPSAAQSEARGVAAGRDSTPTTVEMGPRWTIVSRTPAFTIGVDTSRAQVDEQMHRFYLVWLRASYTQLQSLPQSQSFRTSVWRWRVDCKDRRFAALSGTLYDDKGTVVQNIPVQNPQWQVPIPDSFGEAGANGVCTALHGR